MLITNLGAFCNVNASFHQFYNVFHKGKIATKFLW